MLENIKTWIKKSETREKIIKKILRQDFSFISRPHKEYGKIWLPIYSGISSIPPIEPDVYNREGQKMRTFFIRDLSCAHSPYHYETNSKYFLWDRFNIGLNTHFYTEDAMLQTMGSPERRYGMIIESEAIVPRAYKLFDKYKGLEKDFDLVFTYSDRLLNKLDNARFFPACASSWYGTEFGGGIVSAETYEHKTKNVSMLSSAKESTTLHKFRKELAKKIKREKLADTFGAFDGGSSIEKIEETLTDYRFSIIIENNVSPYFFTERITSCFMAMTIPIYLGATKIDEFFNMDGIITFSPNDNIENILKICTKSEYDSRLSAVKDNFNRAKKYSRVFDTLYEDYLSGVKST